jgi:hypothetical protein
MWVGGTERETTAGERFEELYGSIEAGAFWAAVVFPAGYVPFLTGGIGTTERAVAFAALVAVHLLLLTVGHAHGR